MAKRTPSQPAGGSAKVRARRRDPENQNVNRRWLPTAQYFIKRHGTVEAAIPHAFPGWADGNEEFFSVLRRHRAAQVKADYELLQGNILGDVEGWRDLARKDPREFEAVLSKVLETIRVHLRLFCGQAADVSKGSGRPPKTQRNRSVYMLYVMGPAKSEDSGNTEFDFAKLAQRYNDLFKPIKPLTRHQVSNIVHRETDREIERMAQVIAEAWPGTDPDAMPPPPLP